MKITHGKNAKTGLVLVLLWSLLTAAVLSCDSATSVSETNFRPADDPPFELDPAAEPAVKQAEVVVLAHSRYLFYDLAKEIAAYYDAALLHVNDNSIDSLVSKLKRVSPKYAIVVLPAALMRDGTVPSLFQCFCSLDHRQFLDIGFGYITGNSLTEARDLFYRGKTDTTTIDCFLGVSHNFDQDYQCHDIIQRYADQFRSAGLDGETAIVIESGLSNVQDELLKLRPHQVVFFLGHGSADYSCGIRTSDLNSADLTGSIVLSGSCFSGVPFSDDPRIEPIAMKILERGATFYASCDTSQGWEIEWFLSENICKGRMTFGEAIVDGINRQVIRREAVRPIVAHLIPYGDPVEKPRLKNPVFISIE